MLSSLVGQKADFVRLLLENGVSLGGVLAPEGVLGDLYNNLPSCFFLSQMARRVHVQNHNGPQGLFVHGRSVLERGARISLSHVADEVRHLLGSFTERIYPPVSHNNLGRDADSVSGFQGVSYVRTLRRFWLTECRLRVEACH